MLLSNIVKQEVEVKESEKVYIDTPTAYNHKGEFSHMACKNIEYLHKFAKIIGIKKCWFENKRGYNRPHYDVKEIYYKAALSAGAIPLNRRDFSEKMKELFPLQKKLF